MSDKQKSNTQSGANTHTAEEAVSVHSLSHQAELSRFIVPQNSQSTGRHIVLCAAWQVETKHSWFFSSNYSSRPSNRAAVVYSRMLFMQ